VSDQEKEITQPVDVTGSASSQTSKEGTQPLEVASDAPQSQLPEWLLKFASNQEQSAEETLDADKPELLPSISDDLEEKEAFFPPELPVESEWQEISEFQSQDPMDLEAVEESQESTAELEAFDTSEDGLEPDLLEDVVEPITADPQLEAVNSFKQEVRDLLKQGQREEALALIRDNKSDPVLAEAAKKTLRSQLTLSSDAGNIWDIYDELNSSSD
jgi:hypothetical protein